MYLVFSILSFCLVLVGFIYLGVEYALYKTNIKEHKLLLIPKIEFDSLVNRLIAEPENFILDGYNLAHIKKDFIKFVNCDGFLVENDIWVSNGWCFLRGETNKYNKDSKFFNYYFSLKNTFLFYKHFNNWKKEMKGKWQSNNRIHNTEKVTANGEKIYFFKEM